MAIMSCPACETLITTSFEACPHCGFELSVREKKSPLSISFLITTALLIGAAIAFATPFIVDHLETNETIKIAESEVSKYLIFQDNSRFVEKKAYRYSHKDYQVLLIVETPGKKAALNRKGFIVEIIHDIPQVIRYGKAEEMEQLWSPQFSRLGKNFK